MKIAIIGYGKMGKMVEKTALLRGHEIAAIVDPFAADSSVPGGGSVPNGKLCPRIDKTIGEANLDSVDVAIEFSRPGTVIANITAIAEKRIPMVTGTTGWLDRLDEARKAIENSKNALLWASNFSIGVNLFYRIAWFASELANNFQEYDIGGFEAHHNKKLDSPSGTAKTLAEGVLSRVARKKKIVWETMNREPLAEELHFPSLRVGSVPGKHSLFFDSPADTIEISHTARSREGFAEGAVQAAEWLTAEKRQGVFTIDDMLKDIIDLFDNFS